MLHHRRQDLGSHASSPHARVEVTDASRLPGAARLPTQRRHPKMPPCPADVRGNDWHKRHDAATVKPRWERRKAVFRSARSSPTGLPRWMSRVQVPSPALKLEAEAMGFGFCAFGGWPMRPGPQPGRQRRPPDDASTSSGGQGLMSASGQSESGMSCRGALPQSLSSVARSAPSTFSSKLMSLR